MNQIQDIAADFRADLGLGTDYNTPELEQLTKGNSKYIKDLRLNFKKIQKEGELNAKEIALLGVSLAANANNKVLGRYFDQKARQAEASDAEIAEAIACASLLANNNVFYRFRHFMEKETYEQMPAGIRMNIMMKPVTGKAFFELASLAVSAVNGCERCVVSHEKSLLDMGESEAKVFEAVRFASIFTSVTKVIY